MRRCYIAPARRSLCLFVTSVLSTAAALLTPITSAQAVTVFWNSSAGGDFNTAGNWNPATVPGINDIAVFDTALSGNVTLSAAATVGSIHFDTSATSFALGTLGGNSITTANNGSISVLSTLTAPFQTFTINSPLVLTPDSASTPGAFTIQNDGTSASTSLVIAGPVSSGSTSSTQTLTLGGANTGANQVSGIISNGAASALAVVKSGAGTWTLSGANTYTGGTSIAAGTLALSGGNNRLLSTSTVSFTGASGTLDIGATSQTLAGINFTTMGTNSHVITGVGGSLTINGSNMQIGTGNNTAVSTSQTVDMSGLSFFTYNRASGSFNVGGTSDPNPGAPTSSGTLTLASTNFITAGTFAVGSFSTSANALNTGTVHLGQTNFINASTFIVGNQKTNALLDFQNLAAPMLTIRGSSGGSSRAAITIATNGSGILPTNATFDLTNNGTVSSTLDAMVSTLLIAQSSRNATSAGQASNGTLTMGGGTLNAVTIILGQQQALTGGNTFSGAATATLNLNGGNITTTTLTFADKLASIATQTISSNFNLYSGTLSATTIQRGAVGTGAGANTASINFNWVDGTISNISGTNLTVSGVTTVNGLTGGMNIVLNNSGNVSGSHTWNISGSNTATLQDTVTLSGAGGITKAGSGTLIINGTNTYAGATVVSEGTLFLSSRTSLQNGNLAAWTSTNLTVANAATLALSVGSTTGFNNDDIIKLSDSNFQAGSTLALDSTAAGAFTFTGTIGNPNNGATALNVTKQGTGTLTLANTQAYTGRTTIASGTLALTGGNNLLQNSSTLSFTGTSGTLDIGSTTQTLTSIDFSITNTNNYIITGTGGTLNVTGGSVQIGGGNLAATPAGSHNTNVDMSGLSNFTYTNASGNFYIGGRADIGTSVSASGTLSTAANTVITAANFSVSPVVSGQGSPLTGTLHFGQNTTINSSNILFGAGKAITIVDFQNTVAGPTLKIRGTAGTDASRANITLGTNNSGQVGNVATVDLTNGGTISSTLDAMVATMVIGRNTRNDTPGNPSEATFIMGLGKLDATTIILGQQTAVTAGNSSGAVTATLSLNGGTITAGTFTLADKLSGAATQTITSNFNLYSGTLEATTIQRGTLGTGAGASAATINFNWVDGTISNIAGSNQTVNGNSALSGLTGGLNIVLNNTGNTSGTHTWNVSGTNTSTVQATATLSGDGSLTKTGTGTLVYTAVNSYTGSTTVNAGELHLNATGGQSIAGNVAVNGGTVRLLQSDQISTSRSLAVSSGSFNLQTFNQTLAQVSLTGGNITGTTGVLTSTTAFDLQSGAVSGILGGTAGAVKSTGGIVTLSRQNTYTGGTIVNGGTLIGTISGALGTNGALTINNGGTFAYRPTTAGGFALGSGALTLAGGSTLGTALGGTLSQSAITSSAAASASGAVKVDIYIIPGSSVTSGTHDLLTVASGLTSGGATYTLGTLYNATNFTLTGFTATDNALRINVASATALTSAFWKGGLTSGNNVWALSNGTASNWVTNVNGTGVTPLVPGAGAIITFSATGASNQSDMVLGASMSVRGIVVNDPLGITLNADGNTLSLVNAGITVNNGAGAVTLNTPMTLGAAQSFTNNSTNLLTLGGPIAGGAFNLTVTGSGNTTLAGGITGAAALTKSGTGTLTISGTSTFSNSAAVNGGTLAIAGTFTGTTINLANTASAVAVLNILPGANITLASGIVPGAVAGSVGAINQSGGSFVSNGQLIFGYGPATGGAFGSYNMTGGSFTDNDRFRVGGGANDAVGVFYQSGGAITLTFSNGLEVAANATGTTVNNSTGIAYITGGTLVATLNRIAFNNTSGGILRGEQTIAGTASVTINGVTTLGQSINDTAILNLNGGVYSTQRLTKGVGTGIVNFNGGTLRASASANAANFFTGLTTANIYSGGITLDTNGQNLTVGQALQAPSGNGVSTIAVTNGGTGYIAAPVVTLTGGGGTGATAVANMVDDGTGNGTLRIASITITSAGTGYTSAPTVSVSGGAGTGAVFGTVTTSTNVSGGLTKTGNGSLTLAAANTYTGATVVSTGTLIAANISAFGINSATTVEAGATLRTNGLNIALGSLAGASTAIVENVNATAATLTVGGNNTSTIYAGTLRDGTGAGNFSLVKTGSGVQALSGTNTYTGTTSVNAGTLQVGVNEQGSIAASSAVTVNGATATLAGTGLVSGSVTVTSGFIRPGDSGGTSAGTLRIGTLNLTSGGTALLQIDSATSNDKISVLNTGGLTLDGRIVVTTSLTGQDYDDAFAVGSTFDLIDWQGVINGTFNVGTNLRNGSADNASQFDLPDLTGLSGVARYWDVSQFLTTGTIAVVVPEPGRATFLMLALGSLALRRRRDQAPS